MTEEFPSIEAFYVADERRRLSPEADFGVWWIESDDKPFPHWRVSYVRDTGEVYAVEYGDKEQVLLLGTYPIDEEPPVTSLASGSKVTEGEVYYLGLDRCLDGWDQMYPKPLSWVVERLERAKRRRRTQPPHRQAPKHRDYQI